MSASARSRKGRGTAIAGAAGSDGRSTLSSQAEILKLATLLHREPDTLDYLEALSIDDLRALREQVTDVLFSADLKTLTRLAGASKVLPAGVIATIAQKAFGPVLAARIAGLLEPGRAVEVAAKLPPAFLADIAIELDPRRAIAVITRIPPAQIAAATRELVARQEYVTMGRFVGHFPDETIQAALGEIDDSALLRIGFVLEQKQRIDHIVGLLDQERFDGLVDAAAEEGLWPEALDLLGDLGKRRQRRLAEIAIGRGDGVLGSLVDAAEKHDMWDVVLQLESVISDASRERFLSFVEENRPALYAKLGSGRRP
jgi:hypothetical protein